MTEQIARSVLAWLNTWPDRPAPISYEYLPSEGGPLPDGPPGLALATVRGERVRRYLRGGARCRYRCRILCRSRPDCDDGRLRSGELLDELAAWAVGQRAGGGPSAGGPAAGPDLGPGRRVLGLTVEGPAALSARSDGGGEDYQILLAVDYVE